MATIAARPLREAAFVLDDDRRRYKRRALCDGCASVILRPGRRIARPPESVADAHPDLREANIAVTQPMLARPMIALFVLANLGHALLTARYFFPVPVVFDLLIAACLAWALATAGRA